MNYWIKFIICWCIMFNFMALSAAVYRIHCQRTGRTVEMPKEAPPGMVNWIQIVETAVVISTLLYALFALKF